MAARTDLRTRLQRDGTAQAGRRLAALDPASAPVDARTVGDFLVFARALARKVIYYEEGNADAGSWEAFFAGDASVVIASIERTNPLPLRDAFRNALEGPPMPESLDGAVAHLVEMARLLEGWRASVGAATGFADEIDKRIRATLATTLPRLAGYEQAAVDRFGDAVVFETSDYEGFSDAWSLPDDPAEVAPDPSFLGGFGGEADAVRAARTRLEALFVPLYNVLLEVIGLAPRYFEADLSGRRNHQPHLALFVAFLRLFLLLRDDTNRLTQQHLDFFYERVLGLRRRPAVPDHVHVLVELAKNVDEHAVPAGTALDAGKDGAGVALRYTLDDALVANTAAVASLRTVYADWDRDDPGFPAVLRARRLYAAPVADSSSSMGAPIEDEEVPSWPTLGSPGTPPATVGFALASPALRLAEGVRTITLALHVAGLPDDWGALDPSDLSDAFEAALSSEEGWIAPAIDAAEVQGEAVEVIDGVTVRTGTLDVTLTLDVTQAAVVGALPDVLLEDYATSDPMLKLTLRQPDAVEPGRPPAYAYRYLAGLRLRRVVLKTEVAGATTVVVQNDRFVMDAAKPFQPFGATPRAGSHFYVGHPEVFGKNLTSLTLHPTWEALPIPFADHYAGYDVPPGKPAQADYTATAAVRQDGTWNGSETPYLFTGPSIDLATVFATQAPRVSDTPAAWTPATLHGFLRLTLQPITYTGVTSGAVTQASPFFHDDFVRVMTRQALAAARLPTEVVGARYRTSDGTIYVGTGGSVTPGTEAVLPEAPYTPTVSAFTLDYEARLDTNDAETGELVFFHLEPFGHRRLVVDGTDAVPLVPPVEAEGTLYIGLTGLEPGQSLSLLFRVAEATADPDLLPPPIGWAYLAGDAWVAFEEQQVAHDTTHGLVTSGIVTLAVPNALANSGTRMPAGAEDAPLQWLRTSAVMDAAGVSETLAVHAQAVRGTYADGHAGTPSDPAHLAVPLEAGTIDGLVKADPKVKAVEQPYDSFGGRPAETNAAFYTRVAERLRHKGRAVTLFDYERLVLEQFPELYKVKCINHTTAEHALAPGHVLVAVVPDLTRLQAVDRRRPRATLATLQAVTAFLEGLNCPFVRNDRRDGRPRLHVKNPVYETVRVAFNVRFHADVTAREYHRLLLVDAINRFLSPWAYDDAAEVAFGGVVYKSSILNFVEEQPYVDFVTDFVMTHDGGLEDVDAIAPGTPRSVLVPAEDHAVTVPENAKCPLTQPLTPQGLGAMVLRQGFTVHTP